MTPPLTVRLRLTFGSGKSVSTRLESGFTMVVVRDTALPSPTSVVFVRKDGAVGTVGVGGTAARQVPLRCRFSGPGSATGEGTARPEGLRKSQATRLETSRTACPGRLRRSGHLSLQSSRPLSRGAPVETLESEYSPLRARFSFSAFGTCRLKG